MILLKKMYSQYLLFQHLFKSIRINRNDSYDRKIHPHNYHLARIFDFLYMEESLSRNITPFCKAALNKDDVTCEQTTMSYDPLLNGVELWIYSWSCQVQGI
jgi:hypothetical protein